MSLNKDNPAMFYTHFFSNVKNDITQLYVNNAFVNDQILQMYTARTCVHVSSLI